METGARGDGACRPGLLDSYDAERRPVGEEVVGRTVRSAREGIGADSTDPDFVIRREAQLLIDYGDSPIVTGAGGRAPDATGMTRDAVTGPLRLYSLLGRREHTTLLYAPDGPVDVGTFEKAASAAVAAAHGHMDVYLIAAPGADVAGTVLPVRARHPRGIRHGRTPRPDRRCTSCGPTAIWALRPPESTWTAS